MRVKQFSQLSLFLAALFCSCSPQKTSSSAQTQKPFTKEQTQQPQKLFTTEDCRTALNDYYRRLFEEYIYAAKTRDMRNLCRFGVDDTAQERELIEEKINEKGLGTFIEELLERRDAIISAVNKTPIRPSEKGYNIFIMYQLPETAMVDSVEIEITKARGPPGVRIKYIRIFSDVGGPKYAFVEEDYTIDQEENVRSMQQELATGREAARWPQEQMLPRQEEEQRWQEEQPKEPEEGPRIYGINEWAPISNYNLELKVNDVYKKRIGWGEIWEVEGLPLDKESSRDIEEINQHYIDVLVVNLTARGTTTKESDIDLNWVQIVYPSVCPPYTKLGGLLKIVNGSDEIRREVTNHTYATFNVPYIISTNIGGDPSETIKVPHGILRIGTTLDPNVQIEIGRLE